MRTKPDIENTESKKSRPFGFKLWVWYMVFTVGILLLLWLLEAFALDYLYKPMIEAGLGRDIKGISSILKEAEGDYLEFKEYLDVYNEKVEEVKATEYYTQYVENLKSEIRSYERKNSASEWNKMTKEQQEETVEQILMEDETYQENIQNRIDGASAVQIHKITMDAARKNLLSSGEAFNYSLKREIRRFSSAKEGNGYLIFITDSKGNILYSLNDYNMVFKLTKGQYMEMLDSEYIATSVKVGVTNQKTNSDLLFFNAVGGYSAMRGVVSPTLTREINKVLQVNKAKAELERATADDDSRENFYVELKSSSEEIAGERYMTYGMVVHRGAFFRGIELTSTDIRSMLDSIFKSWYSDDEYVLTHCDEDMIEMIVRADARTLTEEDLSPENRESTLAKLRLQRDKNDESGANDAFTSGSKEDIDTEDAMYIFVCAPATVPKTTKNIIILSLSTILGLALLVNTIIAIAFSRKFEKPIRVMTAEATRLSKGDFNDNFSQGFCRELDDLSNTLSETARALESIENNRRDVLANVSHDLRTPLTMIRGYAEMIRDFSWSDEESREQDLAVIIRESDRLKELVNEVLEYTAMQSSKEEMKMQLFDISTRVQSVVGQIQHLSESKGYVIRTDIDDGLFVMGDELKLERVMYNFLDNAITHTGNSREIEVSLKSVDGKARFAVRDFGKGINKGEELVIWERYHTTRNKDSVKSVSGLGLSIAKEILEAHGAEYGVVSDSGCTFWFALPEDKS